METRASTSLKHWFGIFQSQTFWQICKRLIPYLGSALILWLLLRQIGLQPVWELLVQVNGSPYTRGWLLAGFGWYLLTNVCRAYRFGVLLSLPGMVRPLRLVPDMIILSFLNNVLPARIGELLFPLWLQRRHQTPIGQSLALLLITRLFDFLAVAFLFLIFAFLVRGYLTAVARQVLLASIAILLPTLLLLATLPWLGQRGLAFFDWLLSRLGLADHRFSQRLRHLGERVVTAVVQVHQGRTYLKTFFWSLLAWLCTFAWFASFLQAMALPTPYTFVVVGATFAVLANAIPFITVGGFGAHDAGWAFGFSLFGMEWETAVASGFAVNVLTVLASVISSGVLAPFYLRKTGH
ncbi:MAG TPA: lysylphosphatidylglycerol synthase transmembrane domain-containing protein [Chloroflexota bacterium]|nr:lysylphosphatidylglycerol synthase transmembrane domain-containing protein [Chloroflexota bacterium]HUM68132.1 lysylphosphatidylglycerol synthase transmembrane domain-containing protein [Chloroflexota bacterium]